MSLGAHGTVLDALERAMNAATAFNSGTLTAPAAILWPDEARNWEAVLPALRARFDNLLTLGRFDESVRTGPAIWIRHQLKQMDAAPIIYLPGVGRSELRAVETCRSELAPLAELQYRGVFFSQRSTRDWTTFAFLASKDALNLDLAQDFDTLAALKDALPLLLDMPIAELRGRRLEAEDFHAMLAPDPIRDMLSWMNAPAEFRGSSDDARWNAFCGSWKGKFDPATDGALTAAEAMASKTGPWKAVWLRFEENPRAYPGVANLLANPTRIDADPSCWSRFNTQGEEELRSSLAALHDTPRQDAADAIVALEEDHAQRRDWVWATLGQAPLAEAIQHLAEAAAICQSDLGGTTPEAMAELYEESAWKADGAIVAALASVRTKEDFAAVEAAVRAVYLPWLDQAAKRFQQVVLQHGYPGTAEPTVVVEPGDCILFADGLRYDAAQRFSNSLVRRGFKVAPARRWSALPSVTPTCKPAVAPFAEVLSGSADLTAFAPANADGKELSTNSFRKLLAESGYQYLPDDDDGDPNGKAWTEHGDLDHRGHDRGAKLPRVLDEELGEMVARIEGLFAAGWKRVRVVTDHGWLLMPGGLPKAHLPKFLADSRWGRCATLSGTASGDDYLVVDWRWSSEVRIAMPRGVSCFKAGTEYTHGGLSLQECLTTEFWVTSAKTSASVVVDDVYWRGMRCNVTASGATAGMTIDLRLKAGDPSSSKAAAVKALDEDGHASVVVPDDDVIGQSAYVVALDADGKVVAQRVTKVGGED